MLPIRPSELLGDPAHGIAREVRPLQIELTKFLEVQVSERIPAIVEAGTGIGKSFAYLTNALDATTDGRRVVVSTAMKSLQQQLIHKDIPYLISKLKLRTRYALQLGKANYGCKRQVHLHVYDKHQRAAYDEFFDKVPYWIWDDATSHGIQLPWNMREHSVAYCNKSRCDHFDDCEERGFRAAKAEQDRAQLLVVNHALVGADIRTRTQHKTSIIGKMDLLIVDEAHKFPEAIRNALACEMPQTFFERSTTKFSQLVEDVRSDLELMVDSKCMDALPVRLPLVQELEVAYRTMHRTTKMKGAFGDEAHAFAKVAREALHELNAECAAGTEAFRKFVTADADDNDTYGMPFPERVRKYGAAMQMLFWLDGYASTLKQYCNAIDLASRNTLKYVVAVDDSGKNPLIKTIPINVGERLVLSQMATQTQPIYMSATLAIEREFDLFAEEVGLDLHDSIQYIITVEDKTEPSGEKQVTRLFPPTKTFCAGTPFNMQTQAWAYYPVHLPSPPAWGASDGARHSYYDALADECYDLLMENEGHAFILVTSYADLEAIEKRLLKRGYPYPLLIQSDSLKVNARERFLRTPHATLIGTRSFWEGIDIPGLHLSLVIIPKLPFPIQSDPIVKAKCAIAGDAWFQQVFIPMMFTDLRQMAGRLIRSLDDRGVLAVLDNRVNEKPYGRRVRDELGFTRWGTQKRTAHNCLRQITGIRKQQGVQR